MIYRIKLQAEEFLKKSGNHTPLGCHWVDKFLNRHNSLKSRFCTPLDKERINAVNYESINNWFKLFSNTMKQYNIEKRDVYNMDEKGFAIGQAGKQKVVVSRHTSMHTYVRMGAGNKCLFLNVSLQMEHFFLLSSSLKQRLNGRPR